MLRLRPYQQATKAAIYNHWRTRTNNPLAVISMGGGSTPVIAAICHDAAVTGGSRVLVVAPNYTSAAQVVLKLRTICPELPVKLLLTNQERADKGDRVVVAHIKSVSQRVRELDGFDHLVLARGHLLQPNTDETYKDFLADARTLNPSLRVVGFAAMAYRLRIGAVCTAEPICASGCFDEVCFATGIRELIRDGYLCPIITEAAANKVDTRTLPAFGGDFLGAEAAGLIDQPALVEAACAEVAARTRDRRAVLIFAAGSFHGMRIVHYLKKHHEIDAGQISNARAMRPGERADLAAQFLSGRMRYLVVDDLPTAGFGAAHVDAVVLMLPTLSQGLYCYMIGQGLRPDPQKQSCLVLDFVGNAVRHGPLDQIDTSLHDAGANSRFVGTECPGCRLVLAGTGGFCPKCNHEVPPPEQRRQITNKNYGAPSADDADNAVLEVRYSVHTKRGARPDAPQSMRVDYLLGPNQRQSEFICVEHAGVARQRAAQWWRQRSSEPVPSTAKHAVAIAMEGGVTRPNRITVRHTAGEHFDLIVMYEFGPLPNSVPQVRESDGEEAST